MNGTSARRSTELNSQIHAAPNGDGNTRQSLNGELITGHSPRRPARAAGGVAARRRIALIDEYEFTRGCIAICLGMLCREMIVSPFSALEDCIAAGPDAFDLIVYHAHGFRPKCGTGSDPLTALKQQLGSIPVLIVSDADDPDAMLEALSAGVRGYVPATNTSLQVVIEVIHLIRAGGIFAPVNLSLMQQPAARPPAPTGWPADRFTPRQLAVLEHLKRGNANKVIAHELSMSEGTVKVHVRNIMKKLRATNRTQAVFRAYNLGAGNPSDGRQSAEVSGIDAPGTRPTAGS